MILSKNVNYAAPVSKGGGAQAHAAGTSAVSTHPAEQGIRAANVRPMSNTQSQGSLQAMPIKNHRKSTSMTTKELTMKKNVKAQLNKSNNTTAG